MQQGRLTDDERDFVFQNWNEGANFDVAASDAFFTPLDLAYDLALDVGGGRVDLCAGIGALAHAASVRAAYRSEITELVCIERNPTYCPIGRKMVPQARWINADIFDWRDLDLPRFDYAISNPPFGKVRRSGNAPRYSGPEFEFHVIDIAAELADYGTFLVPQQSAPFSVSGRPYHQTKPQAEASSLPSAPAGRWIAASASIPRFLLRLGRRRTP